MEINRPFAFWAPFCPCGTTGEIVVAEIDGYETTKEFRSDHGQPRLISHDASGRTAIPERTLNVIGVVRGIVRSYRPQVTAGAKIKK